MERKALISQPTNLYREPSRPARKSAPGPRGLPVLGNIPEVRSKGGLIQFYSQAHRDYGDVVRIRMGPVDQYLIVHPDHVRHVLVANRQNYWKGAAMQRVKLLLGNGLFTSEGAFWQRQRRLMQPGFTPRGVTQFGGAMVELIERTLARWQAPARNGAALDIGQEMMTLTMGIIAETMLSIDLTRDDVVGQAADAGRAFAYMLEFVSAQSASAFSWPLWVPTPANRRFKAASALIQDFLGGVVRERRAQHERHGPQQQDLLDTLLSARDDTTGEVMDDAQVYDEVITIFFAGHETTAQALSWAWYLLAKHPDAESRLHEEVDRVLGGRTPTLSDLPNLPYARWVVEETMRLYPPAWIFVREPYQDDEIGGYPIPAKSMIVLSPYLTHRHPAHWDQPEQFEPARFAPEQAAKRHHYAYFPFGGGPRTCIGNHFALQEAHLAVAMIAQRYRLRLAKPETIEPKMAGTLRPSKPVWMRVEQRAGIGR
ncbi:MAG: cytochrome P450 [Anaerolineae bacterium]|nr:cytochrome P450 [Thermoflexales bacterium]MDW8407065.1 cytochrome P450 [Anaerolineae bacterium]